jgi:hypothetical protein
MVKRDYSAESENDTCDERAPQVAVVEAELIRQLAIQTMIEQHELRPAADKIAETMQKREKTTRLIRNNIWSRYSMYHDQYKAQTTHAIEK